MSSVYLPPLKPIPDGTTKQDRIRMFEESKQELIRLNPTRFNPDGTVKTLWQNLIHLFGKQRGL